MKSLLILMLLLWSSFYLKSQTITDIDGNVYGTREVGEQVWMTSNLKTTRYNDGTNIPYEDTISWDSLTTPGYCWYKNDKPAYEYNGALYNWHVVESNNVCPVGWHVPSIEEWQILVETLGGVEEADKKLRGTKQGCYENNFDANNASGLSFCATGLRDGTNTGAIDFWGGWWSSTNRDNKNARFINIDNNYLGIPSSADKNWGIGVRCVKDSATSVLSDYRNKKYTFYPNPSNGVMYFEGINSNVPLKIFNQQGLLVKQGILQENTFDMSDLPRGMYIVQIENQNIKVIKL